MKTRIIAGLAFLTAGIALAGDPPADGKAAPPAEEQVARSGQTDRAAEPAAGDGRVVEDDAHDAGKTTESKDGGDKVISGMSILGNQEAPKSLVIVPWRSSQVGDSVGISTMLDDSRRPVDRDVFLRALSYYEIRSERTP